MLKQFVWSGAFAALALPSSAAQANDSTATLAAGGLVLTKSRSIEMRSEDLFLSEKQVRVRYRFANTSPRAQTVEIAFPLPDLVPDPLDNEGAPIPINGPTNFLKFSTIVDGKPVHAQVELKAVLAGVDQTSLLNSLHVPLNPWSDSTEQALGRLSAANQQKLMKLKLAVRDCCDVGPDGRTHDKKGLRALWTLKTTYFWQQTFPAAREITIEHRYAPVVGHWLGNNWDESANDAASRRAAGLERREFCVDHKFVASVRAQPRAGFMSDYLRYVLVTGANWKGPIGDFRMTVDKGQASNMVSFCGDHVHKIGPTAYQVHYLNFTPKRDVGVLILNRRGG